MKLARSAKNEKPNMPRLAGQLSKLLDINIAGEQAH